MSEQKYSIGKGTAILTYKTRDLIKKNIPDYIKVNQSEFFGFITASTQDRYNENNGWADMPPSIYKYKTNYYDKYDNIIAYKCKDDDEKLWDYYINPELRDLGEKLRHKIYDEYSEEYVKETKFDVQPNSYLEITPSVPRSTTLNFDILHD